MLLRTLLADLFRSRKNIDVSRWGFDINHHGHMEIDGCDVASIANEYGTPTHVVSKKKLIQNCALIKGAFSDSFQSFEIFYSYKTNCVPGILRLIHEQGIGAEVISPYELWLALTLGVPGERIIFNGPHKTTQSIETAIRNRVKLLNVDSLTDIHKILDVCKETGTSANIGVRLCPTSGWSAQFGLNMKNGEAIAGFDLLARNRDLLSLKAIHIHIGSQITDHKIFARAITEVIKFLDRSKKTLMKNIKYLDVGGGFGVSTVREIGGLERRICDLTKRPFSAPNPNICPSIEDFAKIISDAFQYCADKFDFSPPTVAIEPGRVITSGAQALLLSVQAIKKRKTPTVILDGGKMNITYPTSFEYHEIFVSNKMRAVPEYFYNLVGRTCTPSDTIYSRKRLPPLDDGDIIAIMDAGAYFSSFSNSFAFPRPCIVLADNGRTTMLRKRETFDAMVSRDIFQ